MRTAKQRQLDIFATRVDTKKHATEIHALVPIAIALALKAGRTGITVSNLRIRAKELRDQGKLDVDTTGADWLGAVMPAAKLRKIGEWRRSDIDEAHGNLNRVYVHQDFYEVAR